MPDWDGLRFILALHRSGTLAGAARALKVDETTVGRRIAATEHELGAKLFHRTPAGYRSRPAAAKLLVIAERMEESLHDAERQIAGQDDRVEGTVRVTCPDSMSPFLAARLGPLRARHPALQVHVGAAAGRLSLSRREADVAVRIARPDLPNLFGRRAAEVGFAPYVSRSYLSRHGRPRARGGFAGHDVLGFSDDLAPTPAARWLAGVLADAEPQLRFNSFSALAAAAAAGLGIAVLPCFLGSDTPGLTAIPPGVIATGTAWLIVHEDMRSSARVRAVMDGLAAIFRDERARFAGTRR